MPMEQHSILAGKYYRTPEDELRQVTSIEDGDVVYTSTSGTHGAGMISKVAGKRVSMARFASDVENEVQPEVNRRSPHE